MPNATPEELLRAMIDFIGQHIDWYLADVEGETSWEQEWLEDACSTLGISVPR